MVGGAVAFDGQDHLAGAGGVLGGEVDPVAGGAVLGDDGDARGEQVLFDVAFEGVERGFGFGGGAEVGASTFRVGQVAGQELGAFGAEAGRFHLLGGERGD